MNKIFWPLLSLVVFFTGCQNKTISIELDQPTAVISNLEFEISGRVNGLKEHDFFYLVEDGHSFLSEGKVTLQKNGEFKAKITIKSPSNNFGQLVFYRDVNQNGEFDIEMDTQQKISTYDLVFDKSLIVLKD